MLTKKKIENLCEMALVSQICLLFLISLACSLYPFANPALIIPLKSGKIRLQNDIGKMCYYNEISVLFNDYDENGQPLNYLSEPLRTDVELLEQNNAEQALTKAKRAIAEDPLVEESRAKEMPFLSRNLGTSYGVGIAGSNGVGGHCFCCRAFVCRRQACPCSKFLL